jgi:hypothetical protein
VGEAGAPHDGSHPSRAGVAATDASAAGDDADDDSPDVISDELAAFVAELG